MGGGLDTIRQDSGHVHLLMCATELISCVMSSVGVFKSHAGEPAAGFLQGVACL